MPPKRNVRNKGDDDDEDMKPETNHNEKQNTKSGNKKNKGKNVNQVVSDTEENETTTNKKKDKKKKGKEQQVNNDIDEGKFVEKSGNKQLQKDNNKSSNESLKSDDIDEEFYKKKRKAGRNAGGKRADSDDEKKPNSQSNKKQAKKKGKGDQNEMEPTRVNDADAQQKTKVNFTATEDSRKPYEPDEEESLKPEEVDDDLYTKKRKAGRGKQKKGGEQQQQRQQQQEEQPPVQNQNVGGKKKKQKAGKKKIDDGFNSENEDLDDLTKALTNVSLEDEIDNFDSRKTKFVAFSDMTVDHNEEVVDHVEDTNSGVEIETDERVCIVAEPEIKDVEPPVVVDNSVKSASLITVIDEKADTDGAPADNEGNVENEAGTVKIKVSKKELKKLKKKEEFDKLIETAKAKIIASSGTLDNFALSQAGSSSKSEQLDNQLDIRVENFSIAAKGKDLFVNASLQITHGRRYGLVGPNGYGKTTLLRYIATRAINIPANIDVLLCEQEVQADSTPAFEMVLKSDKKRLELLEEFEKIKSRLETEHSQSLVDKLNEVCEELVAIKADAAEGKADAYYLV
uniref:Translation initiation factor IF-2 n=1 Tax=Trichobilharzia regenti TaxID=157069 RepID=A0AA85JQJ1_TRIRE|nr:unnamed protein product [Trichobilharzia regenti]